MEYWQYVCDIHSLMQINWNLILFVKNKTVREEEAVTDFINKEKWKHI